MSELTREVRAELERLLAGCPSCRYDEAEGDVENHCSLCQFRITAWVYGHGPALLAAARRAELLEEVLLLVDHAFASGDQDGAVRQVALNRVHAAVDAAGERGGA